MQLKLMLSRIKQSIVVPVKVDIEAFIERSQLYTYMTATSFCLKREFDSLLNTF